MSDKFRNTFPIPVTFVDGELPTAAKMNAISSQAKSASNLLEYAVGDVWNQAGDQVLGSPGVSTNALMVANIARYLGAAKLTGPRIPDLPNIEEYTWRPHPTDDVGNYEAVLTFPAAGTSTFTWTGTGAPGAVPEINQSDVDAAGEWWLDIDTGHAIFYDAIASDWQLVYEPVVDGDLGIDNTHNIIPDPDQHSSYAFGGVKIQYVNGSDNSQGYYIFLPPRGPLDTRRIGKSPQDDNAVPAHTGNFQTAPLSTNPRTFWQADSEDADISSNADHYRYVLPKIVTDNWSQASTIPTGLVYLWDSSGTGQLIEGVLLRAENAATPRNYVMVATGSQLDNYLGSTSGLLAYPTANLSSTSHAASMYPSGGLRVITVGSSLSDIVSELVRHFFEHDHGSSNSLPAAVITHSKLRDKFYPTHPLIAAQFQPSAYQMDDHPQYLHRAGYDVTRDKFSGAMLGDILMGASDSSGDFQNITSDSFAVIFGAGLFGPRLQYRPSTSGPSINSLQLRIPTGMNFSVQDLLTGGTQGLYFDPDATNGFQINNLGQDLEVTTDNEVLFSMSGSNRVVITNSIQPILGFNRIEANSTELQNSTLGSLSIQRSDKTTDGDGCQFIGGRILSGQWSDGTYGYSAVSALDGYGPVREYLIKPTDFLAYSSVDINGIDFYDSQTGTRIRVAGSTAESHFFETSHVQMAAFDYNVTQLGHQGWCPIMDPPGAGSTRSYMVAFLNLPFAIYSVVGVKLSACNRDAVVAAGQFFVSLGYTQNAPAGVFPNGTLVSGPTDLNSFFPGQARALFPSATLAFQAGTTSTLIDCVNNDGTNPTIPYVMFHSAAGATSDTLQIGHLSFVYRIKEF